MNAYETSHEHIAADLTELCRETTVVPGRSMIVRVHDLDCVPLQITTTNHLWGLERVKGGLGPRGRFMHATYTLIR